MYITFKNHSSLCKLNIKTGSESYSIDPDSSVEVFVGSSESDFSAEFSSPDLAEGFEEDCKEGKLIHRIIYKLSRKFLEKMPEAAAFSCATFKLKSDFQNVTVDCFEGEYAFCYGSIADFFDFFPVCLVFPQAEVESGKGEISFDDIYVTNRKKYLKLMKKFILFIDWGLILPDLFLFIPKYIILRFCSSDFYVKSVIKKLYLLSPNQRAEKLQRISQKIDNESEKGGCLSGILKAVVFLLVLIALVYWANT